MRTGRWMLLGDALLVVALVAVVILLVQREVVSGTAVLVEPTVVVPVTVRPAPHSPAVAAAAGVAPLTAAGAPAATGSPTSAASQPTGVAQAGPAGPVTVAFAGDVHGEPPIADTLARGDNPLEGSARALSVADLAVLNLETAVGSAGVPADKTFTFQADPALADALAEAGVDVVSMANNHALDYGVEGARETLEILDAAGVAAVGFGEDAAAAYAAHVVTLGGRTVAVVGISRVLPTVAWKAGPDSPGMASGYEIDAAAAAVRRAAGRADHVVVMVHWGREGATCPDGDQRALADALVTAGADVIAGHHPHVLQNITREDGALVAWSLGNFVFYARNAIAQQTGVLTVTLDDGGVHDYRWWPGRIDASTGSPVLAEATPEPQPPAAGDGCGPPA